MLEPVPAHAATPDRTTELADLSGAPVMVSERGAYQVVRRVEECERGCAGRFSVERCCRWPGTVGEVGDGLLTLFLCGDVMTGRGVDQVLLHPGDPELRERYARDARAYVRLAERAHGRSPRPGPMPARWRTTTCSISAAGGCRTPWTPCPVPGCGRWAPGVTPVRPGGRRPSRCPAAAAW